MQCYRSHICDYAPDYTTESDTKSQICEVKFGDNTTTEKSKQSGMDVDLFLHWTAKYPYNLLRLLRWTLLAKSTVLSIQVDIPTV